MNLATWSIRNPIPNILLFAFLTLFGLWGFHKLNIQNFPDMDYPAVMAIIELPGTAPAQLETEVARKVEDSMASLPGLRNLWTTITEGRVAITAEFVMSKSLADAQLDVKDAVERVRGLLPDDILEPQVKKIDEGPGGPILTYALWNPNLDEEALSWFTDDVVSHAVMSVQGVTNFVRLGGGTREVRVTVDPVQMNALGVTAADVSRALRQVQREASGGRGELGGTEQGVRTIATVQRAQDLAALPIVLTDGRSLRLDQVATVEDTLAERKQTVLINGTPAVAFQISRVKGYDEHTIATRIEQVMQELEQAHPGLETKLVRSVVKNTMRQYGASMQMLIEGAILAVLVIWWFLRDWRATILGAVALPLSIIPAFAVMYLADYSLNTVTLLGLAVVVGILVDDAVVEVENIARHLHQGKPVWDATVDAVNEIALAVVATTFTLVAVFLPTALMTGVAGLVFKQFGWTVVAAVLASLAVARLVTPMMAIWVLKGGHREPPDGWLMRTYLRTLKWCLHHRKTTLLAAVLIFCGSLSLIPLMSTSFIPPEDNGFVVINMELAPGTTLESSVATAEQIAQAVEDIPWIETVFTSIGNPPVLPNVIDTGGEVRKGTVSLILTSGDRPSQQEIEAMIRPRLQNIPGVRTSIGAGFAGEKMEILLVSQNSAALKNAAREMERELRSLPYFSAVQSTAALEQAEITIRPNPVLAAERGVSTQAIADTVRIALAGDFDIALSKLNLDNRQVDIRVQVPVELREDLTAIGNLRVPGRHGLVPLSSIADLSVESSPSLINRFNRQRQVTLKVDLGGFPLGEAARIRDNLESAKALPPSVKMVDAGDAEFLAEMMDSFGLALGSGILLIYAVLVLLFKEWFQPITILSALPLSIGGAFVALLMGNYGLSLPAFIGLIMLMGIVTKNSILLVDFAVVAQRDHGMNMFDALMDACRKRARPILMTTVAMIAGLLPLALGIGGTSSFRTPMAVSVIGGLVTSTLLSLLIVPVVYIYVSRLTQKLQNLVLRHDAQLEH